MLQLLSETVAVDPATCPYPNRTLEVRSSRAGGHWKVVAQRERPATLMGRLRGSRRRVLKACPTKDVAIMAARVILRAKDGGEIHVLNDAGKVADRIWVLNGGVTSPPLIVDSC